VPKIKSPTLAGNLQGLDEEGDTNMGNAPYNCHVLVCVNDREGERRSCADNKSNELRGLLKDQVKALGYSKKEVRVSQTGCLGLCAAGPNVMIYPQNILYSGATLEDVPKILEKVREIMTS